MDIKLVVVDLDDTLLDDEGRITEDNINTLRQAAAQGVNITIATGRMYRATLPYAKQLGLSLPLITYQGSLIKKPDGEVIRELALPPHLAREMLAYSRETGVQLNVYVDDNFYTDRDSSWTRLYAKLSSVPYNVVGDLTDLISRGPTKLIFVDREEVLDEIAEPLRRQYNGRLNIVKSKPFYLEVTHPAASKAQAVEVLLGRLGIKWDEVMACGDSFNDLDMIEQAGLGVAVGNARKEVKEAADWVAPSNNESGVAEAVRKFVLR